MLTAEALRVDLDGGDVGAAAALELYRRWGCFIAHGLVGDDDLAPLRREIGQLIALGRRERARDGAAPGARFDHGYDALYADDAALADAFFAACRRLTSAHQLSVHPRLLACSRRLMRSELIMSSPYKPIRIDHAGREGFLLPWHQDYPYAQDSPDGVVYWIPLQDVDDDNGCLRVAAGSHQQGVLPVRMLLPPAGARDGIKGLELADARVVERYPQLSLPMRAGEVLVLSTLLVHRSQRNRGPHARWTLQIRHGNFAHPITVQKRWPRGHYERHWFDETHPEHVVSDGAAEEQA